MLIERMRFCKIVRAASHRGAIDEGSRTIVSTLDSSVPFSNAFLSSV
jgi:hypothetical protein